MIPTLRYMHDNETSAAMRAWAQDCQREHRPVGYYWGRVFGSVHVVARNEIHTNRDPAGKPGISLFVCPSAAAEGVDVSDYQWPVDWNAVAKAGKSFVWIKCTEGATGDGSTAKRYAEHWKGAGEAGLLRGAYHFFRMTSSPEAQAKHFFELAQDPDPGMAHVLDVEAFDGEAIGEISRAVLRFLDALPDVSIILYTFPAFWGAAPDLGIERRCRLWIANFDVMAPKVPGRWPSWDWWQYTAKGRCPGIPGNADLDRYRGSLAEMLAGTPAAPAHDVTTTLGVQRALNDLGQTPPLAEDGILGPKTKAALARFQRLAGLDADAIAGPQTRAALLAALG